MTKEKIGKIIKRTIVGEKVFILPRPVGAYWKINKIYLTYDLIRFLKKDELEAVVHHEAGHKHWIKNLLYDFLSILIYIYVGLSLSIFRINPLFILLYFTAGFILFLISLIYRREISADKHACQAGYSKPLKRSLKKSYRYMAYKPKCEIFIRKNILHPFPQLRYFLIDYWGRKFKKR